MEQTVTRRDFIKLSLASLLALALAPLTWRLDRGYYLDAGLYLDNVAGGGGRL